MTTIFETAREAQTFNIITRDQRRPLTAFAGIKAELAKDVGARSFSALIRDALATGEAIYVPNGLYPLREQVDHDGELNISGLISLEGVPVDIEFAGRATLVVGSEVASLSTSALTLASYPYPGSVSEDKLSVRNLRIDMRNAASLTTGLCGLRVYGFVGGRIDSPLIFSEPQEASGDNFVGGGDQGITTHNTRGLAIDRPYIVGMADAGIYLSGDDGGGVGVDEVGEATSVTNGYFGRCGVGLAGKRDLWGTIVQGNTFFECGGGVLAGRADGELSNHGKGWTVSSNRFNKMQGRPVLLAGGFGDVVTGNHVWDFGLRISDQAYTSISTANQIGGIEVQGGVAAVISENTVGYRQWGVPSAPEENKAPVGILVGQAEDGSFCDGLLVQANVIHKVPQPWLARIGTESVEFRDNMYIASYHHRAPRPERNNGLAPGPAWFGAQAQHQVLAGLSMTAGSADITATGTPFSSASVGRHIVVYGAGDAGISGTTLITTVASVEDESNATLAVAASNTVADADGSMSLNDNAALVEFALQGGQVTADQGKTYPLTDRAAGALVWGDGARAQLNGATFLQNYDANTDGGAMALGEGAEVSDFTYRVAADFQFERGISVRAGSTLKNAKVIFETHKPSVDDNYDAAVMFAGGPGGAIEDVEIDGAFKAVDFYTPGTPDLSDSRITNLTLRNWAKGISLASNAPRTVIDGVFVHAPSEYAATDPGDNVVTGGAEGVVIRNIQQMFEGKGAGEHFIYSAVPDGTQGMLFESIFSNGSGQCFIKKRGHDRSRMIDCHGKYSSAGNAPGTNEDGFREEYCRNGYSNGLSMRLGAETLPGQFAGYDGFHLAHCWNNTYDDSYLDLPARAYIHLSTNSTPSESYSTSDNDACEELTWRGLVARKPSDESAKPLLMLGSDNGDAGVKIGNITITELEYDGPVGNLVETQAGITAVTQVAGTRLYIDGRADDKRITYEWVEGSDPTIFYHNPRDLTDTVANLTALTTAASPGLGEAVVPVGQRAFATDATATTFASAAVGGDENTVPVWWDGADWIIG